MTYTLFWTDALFYILLFCAIYYGFWAAQHADHRRAWAYILNRKLSLLAGVILLGFLFVAVCDSIHFRTVRTSEYEPLRGVVSVLDIMLEPLGLQYEKSYSAPFATHLYNKEAVELTPGQVTRLYPKLYHVADYPSDAAKYWVIQQLALQGILSAFFLFLILALIILLCLIHTWQCSPTCALSRIIRGKTAFTWRLLLLAIFILLALSGIMLKLSSAFHIFGTNQIGQDVFYMAVKSIRTGIIIGTITTLIMLPFALFFGLMAGYFGGVVDDVIQYIYVTLSSIPGVLLIVAAILSLQIFMSNHEQWFVSTAQRADLRLLALCIILGITSWTGLCRLLRAETLKLREIDYILAAKTLGTHNLRILAKHVLPNVMHIVIITIVLDFSGLVLAEAVLSYVGVGVDPTAMSWGNMINSARLELARVPIVWWPLLAAFSFMFTLVLSANLFADAVRDGYDPRTILLHHED